MEYKQRHYITRPCFALVLCDSIYDVQECDGGLRNWLLTTVCVTTLCAVLGALFHGRGGGTRPSRFLDADDDNAWGVDDDSSISVSVSSAGSGAVNGVRTGLGVTGNNNSSSSGGGGGGGGEDGGLRVTPPFKAEEGRAGRGAPGAGAEAAKGGGGAAAEEGEYPRQDSMGEDSIVS